MLSPNQQEPSSFARYSFCIWRTMNYSICHTPPCHKSKLHVVNFYNLSHSSFNHPFQNLHYMLHQLYAPVWTTCQCITLTFVNIHHPTPAPILGNLPPLTKALHSSVVHLGHNPCWTYCLVNCNQMKRTYGGQSQMISKSFLYNNLENSSVKFKCFFEFSIKIKTGSSVIQSHCWSEFTCVQVLLFIIRCSLCRLPRFCECGQL